MLGSQLAVAWNPWVGLPLIIVGGAVLLLVWLFGEPKKEQGKRRLASEATAERREPTLGESVEEGQAPVGEPSDRMDLQATPRQDEMDVSLRAELEKLGATLADQRHETTGPHAAPSGPSAAIVEMLRSPAQAPVHGSPGEPAQAGAPVPSPVPPASPTASPAPQRVPPRSNLGKRPTQVPVERIMSLFVMAREGGVFHGADLIVAAEKAGLEYGDMGIYHRLVDGRRDAGPIFSVANMLKPGSFDLTQLDTLRTSGLSFFMTLPGPTPALDAWDAMLPTAQRLAELLDGQVLDEERNALGRQRIAHIRDELRGWDREHDAGEIRLGR